MEDKAVDNPAGMAFVVDKAVVAVGIVQEGMVKELVVDKAVGTAVVGIGIVVDTQAFAAVGIQVAVAEVFVGVADCQTYVRTSLDYSSGKFLIASEGPGTNSPRLKPTDNMKRHAA